MPTTEGGSTFSNIACGPHDTQLVNLLASLVIGNDDIELAFTEFVELEGRDLVSSLNIVCADGGSD